MTLDNVNEFRRSMVGSWRVLFEKLAGEFPHARQWLSDAFGLAEEQMRLRAIGSVLNWDYVEVDVQQSLDLVASTEPSINVDALRDLFRASHQAVKAMYDLSK